ncbi:hypothetical protein KEM55_004774, partial [Ascosphaera atra]
MASDQNNTQRPGLPRSLTRMESASDSFVPPELRERAKTFNYLVDNDSLWEGDQQPAGNSKPSESALDVFEERSNSDSSDEGGDESKDKEKESQSPANQLPIEVLSMVDRFVNSLSAKSYTSPPTIDQVSELFQDFYIRAADHIATHIATLASRQSRGGSPSSARSRLVKPRKQDGQDAEGNDHQMLTPGEVAERRKMRKQLQHKRIMMEEAVERRACESVYKKVWRHKSSMDEVRDEKLRSKTAALKVVGIDLKDLGVDIGDASKETKTKLYDSLDTARECLTQMNDDKYPLGKLQHLTQAHKAIVDTLTNVLPSNSSADEILPTLIYTLITGPVEGINIISNLLFIQRFRTASKIEGEAAYCLTNLEASISFLENVDLASIRSDETQTSAPSFASGQSELQLSEEAKLSASSLQQRRGRGRLAVPGSSPGQSPPRRISDLFQPPAKVLGAANDAVRSTADQGLKNLTMTLDNSFKFFLGRINESQRKSSIGSNAVVPKTLDEARQLVSSPKDVDKESESEESSLKDVPTAEHSQDTPAA